MQAAGQEGGDDAAGNVGRDTDGRGSANQGGRPRDPNVEAVTDAFEGRGNEEGSDAGSGGAGGGAERGRAGRVPDAIDLQDMNGASRREPGR
jgi:hypothetical protein